MSLQSTPGSERIRIGFFGRTNVGKSSLVNALCDQDVAVVAPTRGTTTDPVGKSMELFPLGPVVILDTPGFDDPSELGGQRMARALRALERTDIAVLVVDASTGLGVSEQELLRQFKERRIPYLTVYNKIDLCPAQGPEGEGELYVSAVTRDGIETLKDKLSHLVPEVVAPQPLIKDLVRAGATVVLVVHLDAATPKGRLILPQQLALRELLEANATAVVTLDTQLEKTLGNLAAPPALVVTDSQVFKEAAAATPETVPLVSFSILMARYKGFLETAVKGARTLRELQDGDRILIAEGCTHHVQCEDIGRVKLPRLLRRFTQKELDFEITAGNDFPDDLTPYRLVIHCGGCMQPDREIAHRLAVAKAQGIPLTNYGVAIAAMQGILRRSLDLFPDLQALLD